MVTRKPVAGSMVPAPLQQVMSNPPYPVASNMPSEPHGTYSHDNQADNPVDTALHRQETRSRSNSNASTDTWNSSDSGEEVEHKREQELPQPLRPGTRQQGQELEAREELPAALRAGPPGGMIPGFQQANAGENQTEAWATQMPAGQHTPLKSHNPFLHMRPAGQQTYGNETSQSVWGDAPPPPSSAPPPPPSAPPRPPVELPTTKTPIDELANLSFGNHGSDTSISDGLTAQLDGGLKPMRPVITGTSTGSQRSQSSNPWQDDLDREQQRKDDDKISVEPPIPSLLDEDPIEPPSLPTRTKAEKFTPSKPPRLSPLNVSDSNGQVSSDGGPDTPSTRSKKQRNEFYHIKQVNWYDKPAASSGRGQGGLRRSSILTQNANGPCPLLALVNALSLSTPASVDTALLETLRSREQITLGLLLDAVFEELVRRNESSGHDLPDIGDLYSFLVTLHTGMNVNPCFTSSISNDKGSRPTAGSFEETREMRLYSTFDIPLIHGWTAPPNSATYAAFERSAQTFEDAQNIQFREEELEDKLRSQGLTSEEQQIFEDVASIKQFLSNYPTQLTDFGLEAISKAVAPGQMVILFRNDHFSTLYKEPRTGALMTLVTDAGYSTHDEIVWESLVDVNGAASELFSGDFRPVGTTSSSGQSQHHANLDDASGWQTVQPRNQRNGRSQSSTDFSSTVPSQATVKATHVETSVESIPKTTEQEDHDLALALQLQEEEEDSHRREAAERRQREETLSRQFLSREQGPETPPVIPPRRNTGRTTSTSGPPPVSHHNPSARTDEDTAPPPSYEQAASDRPYRPPGSTPARQRQGDALGALGALEAQRQQSAFAAQSSMSVNTIGSRPPAVGSHSHRRRSSARLARAGSQQSYSGTSPGASPYAPNYPGDMANGVPGHRVSEQEKCIVM